MRALSKKTLWLELKRSTHQLDVAAPRQENVFGLEIAVDDVLRVEVLDGYQDLGHVEGWVGLVQRGEPVQKVKEFAALLGTNVMIRSRSKLTNQGWAFLEKVNKVEVHQWHRLLSKNFKLPRQSMAVITSRPGTFRVWSMLWSSVHHKF